MSVFDWIDTFDVPGDRPAHMGVFAQMGMFERSGSVILTWNECAGSGMSR